MRVTITTNVKSLNDHMKARTQGVFRACVVGQYTWGAMLKRSEVALSKGTIKTADLRLIRPGLYSKARTPTAAAVDAVINQQKGELVAAWHTSTVADGPLIVTTNSNSSDHAKFMEGTDKMRKRPIVEAALAQTPSPASVVIRHKRRAEMQRY